MVLESVFSSDLAVETIRKKLAHYEVFNGAGIEKATRLECVLFLVVAFQ